MSRLALLPQRESTAVASAPTVSVATIAWVAVVSLFLALRFGHVLLAPVGGAELVHLSGAWQAREGIDDDRFVPTLFQALSAASLFLTTSEVWPRLLVLLATATIPAAVFILRLELGRAGALLALLFLSLDGVAINLGASASAMGFDLAIAAWLLVAALRPATPAWIWAVLAFLVATAGPLPLALAFAVLFVRLLGRPRSVLAPRMYATVLGFGVGVVLASAGFGFGFDAVVVAPVQLLIAGFEETWSTATALEAALLYGTPILVAGAGAVLYFGIQYRRAGAVDSATLLLLAWTAIAFVWFLASASSHTTVPAVALTTPLALLLGPATARGLSAMLHANWRIAGPVLGASAFVLSVALYVMLDWARLNRAGPVEEVLLVAALVAVAAIGALALAFRPGTPSTLVPAALALAAVPLVSGAFGIAFGGYREPVPSPFESPQVAQIRFTAGELSGTSGGPVVVHPSVASDATWPLRDIDFVVSAEPGPETALALWPAASPGPDGLLPLDGTWALVRRVEPPLASPLRYLRWLTNRNVLGSTPEPIALYGRQPE